MSELEKIIKTQAKLRKIDWRRGTVLSPLGDAVIILHRHTLKGTQFYAQITAPSEDLLYVTQPEEAMYIPEIIDAALKNDRDIIELHTFRHLPVEDCLMRVKNYAHAYCATYMDMRPARFTPEELLSK